VANVLRSYTTWYNPKIKFQLTSCGTPQDKVGSSRNPREVKKVVETGSTCDTHGHSHHRTATDPVGTIQNLTQCTYFSKPPTYIKYNKIVIMISWDRRLVISIKPLIIFFGWHVHTFTFPHPPNQIISMQT
jgi:hypothetical protein